MNDQSPPPLPPADPAESYKTKDRAYLKLVVTISVLSVLCMLGLLFALAAPSAINAFNKGRQSAIRKNLAKTAEVTVGNIDQMQKYLKSRPGEQLPPDALSAPGSTVVLGIDTPQEYMERNFGGGSMTVAGLGGEEKTSIVLPDGRRFEPPPVISKGFSVDQPEGWQRQESPEGMVTLFDESGTRRLQVIWRDVHRGKEKESQKAWIDEWVKGLPSSEKAAWVKEVGAWKNPHAEFYRVDAGGSSGREWRGQYHFTATPGRVWLVRSQEDGAGELSPEVQALIQSFQPL